MQRRPLVSDERHLPTRDGLNRKLSANGHAANGHFNGADHSDMQAADTPKRGYEWMELVTAQHMQQRGPGQTHDVYQPHMAMMAFQLALLGSSQRMIANALNVSERTVINWKQKREDFRTALLQGAELADARVAESLYHRAIGYEHAAVKIIAGKESVRVVPYQRYYPPDTQAAVFWLTNRQRALWRNRTTTELTGVDGEQLIPPQLVVQPVRPNGHDTTGAVVVSDDVV